MRNMLVALGGPAVAVASLSACAEMLKSGDPSSSIMVTAHLDGE
ncbi:hypothetical protein [Scrofimicrobium canadense]|nr:hypothetical protein [Scrofimicrobium canadense]